MQPFCRLRSAASYAACPWDLSQQAEARAHFVPFFRAQYNRTLALAVRQAALEGHSAENAAARAEACRREFFAYLDRLEQRPQTLGRTTILTIDAVRDGLLRAEGFADPYHHQKQAQNLAALEVLPGVCRDLDILPPSQRLEAAVRGALAGNIFDMGVTITAQRMLGAELEFIKTRSALPSRPWLVDQFDAMASRVTLRPYRKAIVFIDNAGCDFVLGMVPLCRTLAQMGTRIVIAANELPTLNDMTIADVQASWPQIMRAEPSLAALDISTVSTGTAEPLIDLLAVSQALNAAAQDGDLVILEGMGRALESNFNAEFDCDCLKLAMIKDEFVARWLGGNVYDVVCRFEVGLPDCGGDRHAASVPTSARPAALRG